MSVEIESQSVCDGRACHNRIHEGEACYCHDCWVNLENTINDLEVEIVDLDIANDELKQQLATLRKVDP